VARAALEKSLTLTVSLSRYFHFTFQAGFSMSNHSTHGQKIAESCEPGLEEQEALQDCQPAPLQDSPRPCPSVSILGVPVSLITLQSAVDNILRWIEQGQAQYVCVREVNGLMCAVNDPEIMRINRDAGMVTPDGMPLVWLSRWRSGFKTGRVSGADLVDALCCAGQARGLRHYFYGGKPGVAEVMIAKLQAKYPKMIAAGFFSPPFRTLTAAEDQEIVDRINESGAQVVWVGISTPKQEFWMRDHAGRIKGATLIGVGAAFDFHSGAVARAPLWMQRYGLEWLHRLMSEPRRLWRRYFVVAPVFLMMVAREQMKLCFARRGSPS
jgi:N-acetylglucosaminyldiphosphoundecaprenol N-acetyl-beta-D-mannosaminyltransferase